MPVNSIRFHLYLIVFWVVFSACGRDQFSEETPIEYEKTGQTSPEADQENDADQLDSGENSDSDQEQSEDQTEGPNDSSDPSDSRFDDNIINPDNLNNNNPLNNNFNPPPRPTGRWKTVLFTGDNSINAFDNARRSLAQFFSSKGIQPQDMAQLSMRQGGGATAMSKSNLRNALQQTRPGPQDGCIVHMTSHGSRSGFYLVGQSTLSPQEFDTMIQNSCGNRPTIVMVSACYSGVFVEGMQKRPNLIILTAARPDRTSFGCSPENQYTYWDGCLIEHLPRSQTWNSLYSNVKSCIERKESGGNFSSSGPQAYFGSQMNNLPIAGQMPF